MLYLRPHVPVDAGSAKEKEAQTERVLCLCYISILFHFSILSTYFIYLFYLFISNTSADDLLKCEPL